MSTSHTVLAWDNFWWNRFRPDTATDTIVQPDPPPADAGTHRIIAFRQPRFHPRPLNRVAAQDDSSAVEPELGDESSYLVNTWINEYSSSLQRRILRYSPAQDFDAPEDTPIAADGGSHLVLGWPRLWKKQNRLYLHDTAHEVDQE